MKTPAHRTGAEMRPVELCPIQWEIVDAFLDENDASTLSRAIGYPLATVDAVVELLQGRELSAALAMDAHATRDVLATIVERSDFVVDLIADDSVKSAQFNRRVNAANDLAGMVGAIVGRPVQFRT